MGILCHPGYLTIEYRFSSEAKANSYDNIRQWVDYPSKVVKAQSHRLSELLFVRQVTMVTARTTHVAQRCWLDLQVKGPTPRFGDLQLHFIQIPHHVAGF